MIALNEVSKQYGSRALLIDATFQLNRGDKVGLVGPNGAGKTTLFRLIVGEDSPDFGSVTVPARLTVGYFRQDATDVKGVRVLDEAIAGSGRLGDLHHEIAALEHAMADPARVDELDTLVARFGEIQEEYQQGGGYELEARAREVLHGLGFHDEQIDGDIGALSGGWRMRVSIAKVLIGKPEVLLLDEPTNHLDIESILWLEEFLKQTDSAVFMTCHDRDFMNRVVTRIAAIEDGALETYAGNYDFYDREKDVRAAQQEAAFTRQQAMLKKEERFIERFEKHAAKAAQVQSRIKKLDKIERVEPPKKRIVVPFTMFTPPRSGNDVATISGLTKRYGNRAVIDGLDLEIKRGERWCVMGVNGAGKSTLLKMVAGVLTPDSGAVRLGASLKMGYFAQSALEVLDPRLTIWEQIDQNFPHQSISSKRGVLGAFDFSGDEIEKSVSVLSGGEKSRLVLALMLFDPPNFLVLDEPTNHLDLVTKEMLIGALSKFEGTMLFVSHDRHFLKGLATKVLDLSGGGDGVANRPLIYHGTYEEWVESTGHEAPGVHH